MSEPVCRKCVASFFALLFCTGLLLGRAWAGGRDGMDLPECGPLAPVTSGEAEAPEPPATDPEDEVPPTLFGEDVGEQGSLVFVIDVSGSMGNTDTPALRSGHERERMEQAKQELAYCISLLRPWQRFSCTQFDSANGPWLWESLRPATPENKAEACAWVAKLQPGSGTLTGPAVVSALALLRLDAGEPDRCMLLTDGAANGGLPSGHGSTPAEHRLWIRTTNVPVIPIDVFGWCVFQNPRTKEFCQGVAADSGGTFYDQSEGAR